MLVFGGLPIEQSRKLSVRRREDGRGLGLTISPTLLARANHPIL